MHTSLRDLLERVWRRSRQGVADRRAAKARAHFWSEVRKGEAEAEAGATPASPVSEPSRT
jgi:hypothetical protein